HVTSRTAYLHSINPSATAPGGLGPDDLFTLAFRNSLARRKLPPDTLWFMATTHPNLREANLEEQLKREERDMIAAGLGEEPIPPPVALPAGPAQPEVLPPHQRSDEP